jgi:hypothetical protein
MGQAMSYAEVIDYNTMTAKILKDGDIKVAPLKLCDGCAIFRSPFNGVNVDLQPLMRALWFCEHCKTDPDASVLT